MERILAIFPHPDDAVLNAGGAMARWVEEGAEVTALCVTSGDLGTLDRSATRQQVAQKREAELLAAHEILGIRRTTFLRHPDGGTRECAADVYRDLVRVIREVRPDTVLSLDPWARYEVHPDHDTVARLATEASAFACFPLLFPEQVNAGLEPYQPSECWLMGLLGREPNCRLNIEPQLDRKVQAILQFEASLNTLDGMFGAGAPPGTLQERADDWVRSLARDAGEPVGLEAAEAFFMLPCLPGHFAVS